MGASETNFDEASNIFDTSDAKGMPCDLVDKIPKIKVTKDDSVDGSGEKVCCSVCLQV